MANVNNKDLLGALPLITEKHLNSKVTKLKFIGGGSNGKAFKAVLSDGSVIVLKAYRGRGFQNKEALSLKYLSESTSVPMPRVYFAHEDENFSVLGMGLIEGQNVLNPLFLLKSKALKERFAKDVIHGLSEIHSATGEGFGSLENPSYSSWCEFYRNEYQEPWLRGLSELSEKGKFSKRRLDLLYRATEVFNKVCEEPEKPVLIHADINIMNIMADPKSFKLTGFIDPGASVFADREYDLFQLRNMWGDKFFLYETYKSVHKMSELTDFRVAYYGAMNEASCRLGEGLIMPLWEDLCNIRLEKEMKKLGV